MNIAIVGAGISGISTALEFARDGHQVTVYEQMNAAAEDASFAPGGWLLPLAAQSLAAPGTGMPLELLQSSPASLLQASSLLGSATWRWMRQWSKLEKHANKHNDFALGNTLQLLGDYSASLRWEHCEDTELAAERHEGGLVILRSPQEAALWETILPQLQAQGVTYQVLNAAQVQAIEPGLGHDIPWLSALYFPTGESINPRLWTQFMRIQAQDLGIRFHTGAVVQKIGTSPVGVMVNQHLHPFDSVVICTGAHTPLLAPLGIHLPLMPTWGYSVTAPIRDPLQAPRSAIMDWAQQAVISRMGQRVRITAGLEMGSSAHAPHHQATLQRMYRLLSDWFPGGAQLSSPQVQVWRGVRGHLPDGLPAVGPSGHKGIWINLAHGSHGISLAAGCARLIADMACQRATAFDARSISPLRF